MHKLRTCAPPRAAFKRLLLGAVIASLPFGAAARPADKMRAEDVVAKHLEAVGGAEARAAVKNRVILGTVVVAFRTPSAGQAPGRAVLASEGEKNLIGMVFEEVNYPQDKVGFDGKDVSVSYVRPGRRSALGDFLLMHNSVVKQGLVGGVLSSAWPLSDSAQTKAKLEYGGTKKVGERTCHVVKYLPRGGSDLNITLFFDAETFHHLRTEYTRTLAAQMGASPDASARQRESRYRMVEDYTDFRKEGALTLPHGYKIALEFTLPGGSYKADWEMILAEFSYNQTIDPDSFDVDGK